MADVEEIERQVPNARPDSPSRLAGEIKRDIDKLEPALSTLHWSKLTVNGKSPAPRWGHSSCVVGTQLHVFGGSGVQLFNDYFIYDAVDNAWSTPQLVGQVPGARFGHTYVCTLLCRFACSQASATVVGTKIYLFGGHGTNSKPYSDLYVMELENFSWTKYAADKTWPESRAGHTLTHVPEKGLIGFGGRNNKQKYYNGVFILEKVNPDKTVVWKTPKVNGMAPSPRSSHSATAVGSRLFVFGGFDGRRYYNDLHIFDTDELTWRSPVVKGKIPAPRSGHTATLVGTKLFILGGCSSDSTFMNDVHLLDTETCTWYYLALKGTVFPPRFKHTSCLLRTGLHIFGGTGSGTLFNDVYVLEKLTEELFTSSPGLAPEGSDNLALSQPGSLLGTRVTEVQLDALRQTLQAEREAREKLEAKLAAREGDFLVSMEHTKRLEADLAKLEHQLRAEQEKRTKLDRSVKNEKEKRQKATSAKDALEQVVESQRTTLETFESRFRALESSLNKEQSVRIDAEVEISRLQRREADVSEALERTKRELENSRKQAAAGRFEEKLDLSKMSMVELDAYEQEQIRLFVQITKLKSEQASRLEQELNKLRIEKLVLEEQKAQAQKALQEARKENEILRGRLDASEMSLSKLTQKAISPITPSSSSSIGSALHQQQQVSDDVLRRGSLLSNELGGYSLTELDDLEEYCHKALKRIGIAKQERFSTQIEKLRREKEQLQEQRQCVVCQDKDIRTVIIPCGHQACCRECAAPLKKCPICRSDIGHIVNTF